jgi:hypothetical protein
MGQAQWFEQRPVDGQDRPVSDRHTGRRSPRMRSPELTDLAVGQPFVRIFGRVNVFELAAFRANEHITLRSPAINAMSRVADVSNTYAIRSEGDGTRLHVRVLFDGPRLLGQALALVNLFMMRKQLRVLKALAEREAATTAEDGAEAVVHRA